MKYRILRFFSDGRPAKRIKVVSSRELAELHCKSPLTKGVLRSGVKWFDGFRAAVLMVALTLPWSDYLTLYEAGQTSAPITVDVLTMDEPLCRQ